MSRGKSLDFSVDKEIRKLFHHVREHDFPPPFGLNGAEKNFKLFSAMWEKEFC